MVGVETSRAQVCPQCNFACDAEATECPRCQIVFAKRVQACRRRDAARESAASLGGGSALERVAELDCLLVRQQVERFELFSGYEQANRYTILDSLGDELMFAREESTVWARMLLKGLRPFLMHVVTGEGQPVLTLHRPFRFYFHEVAVHDGADRLLGHVRKRWSLVHRRYVVQDARTGREFEIVGPFWRPWTFRVLRDGVESGVIRKRWSGALRELFTDADFFGIEFPRDLDIQAKVLFLGAVFLIDFLHFENNDRN